jgi:hypothetical protein
MTDLPPPDVSVTHSSGVDSVERIEVKISREDRGKVYNGAASTTGGAVAEVVKKIIADPYTAEWLPGRANEKVKP